MLSQSEVCRRGRDLLPLLQGLNGLEALRVLVAAAELVTRRAAMAREPNLLGRLNAGAPGLLSSRSRGTRGKIERDPEVLRFVNRLLAHGVTYTRIVRMCQRRFGAERAPSKSGVGRHSQKLRQRIEEAQQ